MRAFRIAKSFGHGALRSAGLGLLVLAGMAAAQAEPSYSYSRTSAFTYKANGLLESETVEPDRPDLCVTTTYAYGDSFGNRTGSTISNCAGASALAQFPARSASTRYDVQNVTVAGVTFVIPAGTFATTTGNALSQGEQRRFDPRFGVMTQATGPNGLTSQLAVDEFGRKVLETSADGASTATYYCWLKIYDPISDSMVDANASNTTANSAGCHNGSSPVVPSPRAREVPASAVRYEHAVGLKGGVQISGFARIYYDRLGRKIRVVAEGFDGTTQPANARLIVQDTDYNDYGAAVAATQPYFLDTESSTSAGTTYGVTLTDYDALGRATAVYTSDPATDRQSGGGAGMVDVPGRGSRQMARSGVSFDGLVTTFTDDKGRQRIEEKNLDRQVVRSTDATGAQIVQQFDAFGNVVMTRDPLGNRILADYDVRGRRTLINDPDSGVVVHCYDALGQVKAVQTSVMRGGHAPQACPAVDASTTAPQLAGWTTSAYDVLGRMTSRAEKEFTSTWVYDDCVKGIGKLCRSSTSHGVSRSVSYDGFGRAAIQRTDIAGDLSAATRATFDEAGRLSTQTFPTGVKLRYQYTALGHLNAVKLDTQVVLANGAVLTSGAALWTAGVVNAWGRPEQATFGNGIVSRAVFDAQSGRLTDLAAGPGGGNGVVNQSYVWDSVGLVKQRFDRIGDGSGVEVSDGFQYDELGRLTAYTVSGGSAGSPSSRTVTLQYNALGMLLSKSDVGNYVYPVQGVANGRPHAIQSTGRGISYDYDLNGNARAATGGKWSSVSYTSFNMADVISGAGGQSAWKYDDNHQRIKETKSGRITWYLHPDNAGGLAFEREVASNGKQSNRHYVNAGGQTIAVLVTGGALPTLGDGPVGPFEPASVTALKIEYWHPDQLGSLIATSDQAGAVTARYAYDPFGKRRYTTSKYDDYGNLVVDWNSDGGPGTDRGFTGHEHLDDMGIVHMNGRLYDPTIGRMMQPDPFVQEMLGLQNYDRYGYCYNSPLVCTDPTGYSFLSKLWKKIRPFVAIVVAIYMGPAGAFWELSPALASAGAAIGTVGQAAVAGFVSGAVSTGNLKGAMQGAVSGAIFGGAGRIVAAGQLGPVAAVALHGVAGCVSSELSGGKCGPGALSAAFSKAASFMPEMQELTAEAAQGDFSAMASGSIVSAVIGGTGSVLGGGKFANGAQTGAFGYLFNALVSWQAAEAAAAEAFEKAGYRVERGVAVVLKGLPGALDIHGVADFIAMKDGEVIIGEVKDGAGAKLRAFQRAMFGEAGALERLAIVSAERAAQFELVAGRTLVSQLTAGARLSYTLTGTLGGRAARQAARVMATEAVATRVIFRALAVIGSVPFLLLTTPSNEFQD